ncbi:MAG: CNP1-like family protein [Proteobacteria bacterium]|nr:CNP1-like family protein [Pseudomonadota bacterium]
MNKQAIFSATRRCLRCLPLAALLLTGVTQAQSKFEEDFDDTEKPWQEIAVQLPAAPKQENLIPFYVSPTATYTFSIDTKSLSVGSDAVVRYTLMAKGSGGAENISYEGIRCKSKERKLYAFGRKDGSWSRSHRDKWEPITQHVSNPYHAILMTDFLCDGEAVAGSADDIARHLRMKPVADRYMPK